MKTILFLTNADRLHSLVARMRWPDGAQWRCELNELDGRLGTAPHLLYELNGCKTFMARDRWENVTWLQQFLGGLTGELHVVRHTNHPTAQHWSQATPILESARTRLPLSFGFVGMHEPGRDAHDQKPYCMLADLVRAVISNNGAAITEWPFDLLWGHLQAAHPIEDLLADQLDYLHAVMATGTTPVKTGPALDKAIKAAEKEPNIDELVKALGSKPYETSQYATFTELRDLILDLKEPARTPEP